MSGSESIKIKNSKQYLFMPLRSPYEEWTCEKCGEGHPTGECFNTRLQCMHCGINHQTGHSCLKQLEEQEILYMQLKDKISRTVAKQEYNKRYIERYKLSISYDTIQ